MSKGDRKLSAVIESAFRMGARFDAWSGMFNFDIWQKAFKDENVDPETYAYGKRDTSANLAWDHVRSFVPKNTLVLNAKNVLE